MYNTNRRKFLKGMLASSAIAAISQAPKVKAAPKVLGANDIVQVGIVGIRGKGAQHIQIFHGLEKVRVAAICDVDSDVLEKEKTKLSELGEKVETYTDYRKLLDNKEINAVVLATPNHWHSLQAIWGCQAGKDVYVEKPVSHNVWEGRQLVNAARKYNRIVQTGTQSRSDEALQEVFDLIQKGHIGKIKVVYGFCYKRRQSIGLVKGPQPIPRNIDYNLWTGPAPLLPLRRESLHYDWHWQWPTGCGDIGNQGVHEMDMCRWVLNENALPKRVKSFGGRFGYMDDGDTPNTQVAIFDYDTAPLIFEVAGLPQRKGIESMDNYKGVRIGIIIECEDGYFAGGSGGGWFYDNKGVKVKQHASSGGGEHQANFIKAVRSRKKEDLTAEIHKGHLSSALCHIANLSYRIGQQTPPDQIKESTKENPFLAKSFERFENHLFNNWIDLNQSQATVGPWLEIDAEKERFIEKESFDNGFWANQMLTRDYRAPFVVEKI